VRIASITMVGQFPDGIDLHVRNLRWALTPADHIFVVTLPHIIEAFGLASDERVTYVPFVPKVVRPSGWIVFWREFPALVRELRIDPDWFLLMESDIWFVAPPGVPDDPGCVRAFLAPGNGYRDVMAGGRLLQPRIWEGAQLVSGRVIRAATEFGIDFSAVPQTFVERDPAKYEARFGGPISLYDNHMPDTLDELSLYCAVEARVAFERDVRAVHLRGPETLHLRFPEIYRGAPRATVDAVQRRQSYLDVLLPIAVYHAVGLWPDIDDLDWTRAWPDSRRDLDLLLASKPVWLRDDELARLRHARRLMGPGAES
jgi:hypothetical protein